MRLFYLLTLLKDISLCIGLNENKKILIYTISLNDDEYNAIKNKLNEILSDTYEWKCNLQLTPDDEKISDRASDCYRSMHRQFMKFHTSKFKHYFIVGSNCVMLADSVIGYAGFDIVNLNGFITPGTYYVHLEHKYNMQGSNVTGRTIYSLDSLE